jgi:hypothetical protein
MTSRSAVALNPRPQSVTLACILESFRLGLIEVNACCAMDTEQISTNAACEGPRSPAWVYS